MTRNLSYLLGIIITILIGTYFYFTCCSDCRLATTDNEQAHEEIIPVTEPQPTSFPFSVKDGEYAFEVNDNFNFDLSSKSILMPISENVSNGVQSLKSYLLENTNKVIEITGLYRNDEDNPSAFPNLGLARANSVKNYLVSNGIPSAQTNTFGKLMDELLPMNNKLLGPITYLISAGNENTADDLKVLHDEIVASPLVLYFETGEAAIYLTAEQRQKVANISTYLDKVSGAACNVVGHTDNTGNRATNIGLGQERADFVKAYLVRNGIIADKINATSHGPDSPIATNATEEGRSKNRRTVVTLN
ncbi:OmpA family protein [Croceitalea rosinachiae]|uniref:OmpA family protein n=1 Tax=Croceitalea rosinachiae TaxID=3075596 RepID=A0ABU3AC32_9FLAO|nr:OmpA family protein [Croceitalea sp. F388]MDT0606481.1 OmpA family protein [Croceitalea sp. F388]